MPILNLIKRFRYENSAATIRKKNAAIAVHSKATRDESEVTAPRIASSKAAKSSATGSQTRRFVFARTPIASTAGMKVRRAWIDLRIGP